MRSHVIIGASGFLGRHMAEALAARGDRVSVVDVNDFPRSAFNIEVTRADLLNLEPQALDVLIQSADVVHYCLWTSIPATSNSDPKTDLFSNLSILLNVLEALKRRGGGLIIFPSSGGTVYGLPQTLPIPEAHPLDPIVSYGASKLTAEKYLQIFRFLYGIDARIGRISNLYGAGQDRLRSQGAVTTFIHRALAGEKIQIWGDGSAVRDFIHVSDAVAGLLALTDIDTVKDCTPLFNIGSGVGSSLNSILHAIEAYLRIPLDVTYDSARSFDVPVNYLDISKAQHILGWSPRISLPIGIEHTIMDIRSDDTRKFATKISI